MKSKLARVTKEPKGQQNHIPEDIIEKLINNSYQIKQSSKNQMWFTVYGFY